MIAMIKKINSQLYTNLRCNIKLLPSEHSIVEGHCGVVIHQLMNSQSYKFCSPEYFYWHHEVSTYVCTYIHTHTVIILNLCMYICSTYVYNAIHICNRSSWIIGHTSYTNKLLKCVRTATYVYIRMYTHAHMHTHMYTHAHAHRHIHKYTNIHKCIHTCTHVQCEYTQ